MLHFQYAVLGFLILFVECQYTKEDDIHVLPEEFVLDLYEKYKEAVEEGHEEGVVTRRQLHLLNREFDIHVRKLKIVNGYKAHNLVIKEKTDTGPLIYIDNPLESRVPHAYLTLDEFRKELEKRATLHRDKKSKGKQTEVYFENSDVALTFSKKDMRRKKVLGGAKIFEAKLTKSRYFEHTYMPGFKRGKKYHNNYPYYYENRNLNMSTSKLLHSINYYSKRINTTPQDTKKPKTQVTTDTQDLPDTPESSTTMAPERNDVVNAEIQAQVEETSESITALDITFTVPEATTYSAVNRQSVTEELEEIEDPELNTAAEFAAEAGPETNLESIAIAPEEKSILRTNSMKHHDNKLNPVQLPSLRSETTNTTKIVTVTFNKAHNLPTRNLLRESTTMEIIVNVTKKNYINSTVQFKTYQDNETTNTEGDLTASDNDETDTETTTKLNETTTEVSDTMTEDTETTTDDDVTQTMLATEGKETSRDDDATGTVTSTTVSIKTKDQPVRPIWMRPRYKRVTTTRTTTTRRTLGRPLVFMDG